MKYTNELKRIIGLTSILSIFSLVGYVSLEPQLATALSATDNVIITLTVDPGITITSPADSSMSRALGVTADTAIGTTTWNVKTNNVGGYQFAIKATSTPAMRHNNNTDSIANYSEAVFDTPETWSVPSPAAEFGFSAYGTSVNAAFGSGSTCFSGGGHVPSTTLNYIGASTTDKVVISTAATTTQSGRDTTICYAVEQDGVYIPSGTYYATFTATATTL